MKDPRTNHAKSERELQAQIEYLLRSEGIIPLRFRTDKRTTANIGWPDFTFAVNGDAHAWEVKFGKGQLSDGQVALAGILSRHPNRWQWRLITSLEQAKKELKEILLK